MIARVFPRQTEASPLDNLAFFGPPPIMFNREIHEVHLSWVFSYDKDIVQRLAEAWSVLAPVKIGGPAAGDRGDDFVPGMYLKNGYVITSRGCHNKCWFCDVWKREGQVRELPITTGYNILDANLLACSESHIRSVFNMLTKQKERPMFTGGLEAKLLQDWHVQLLYSSKTESMFFAYDTPDDLDPLVEAGKKLRLANFTRSHMRCYVLVGYPKDTIAQAETRLLDAWTAGFLPMAMLWKNDNGDENKEWRSFQRIWARPAITKGHAIKILLGKTA